MTTVQIVGCSNGVVYLYLWSDPKRKYALWNPATRQVREIGTPPLHDMTTPAPIRSRPRVCAHSGSSETRSIYGSGFYLDPVTNAIKVVYCILNLTVKGETTAQVNVFSTATNSWTENENITVPYRILLKRSFGTQATCVNEYIHWLKVEDMYILSYDMNEEVFKRIEVPVRPDIGFHRLGCYEGSLAMFVHRGDGSYGSNDEIDVWVLNNCGGTDQSWSKLLTCVPSRKMAFAIGFFRKDNADLILFWDSDLSLYSYDTENGETKFLGKKKTGMCTFIYSESLVSLY